MRNAAFSNSSANQMCKICRFNEALVNQGRESPRNAEDKPSYRHYGRQATAYDMFTAGANSPRALTESATSSKQHQNI